MSNPTSNFGWQMPTATDLVTDLPADFEVFGQAVDTTLVDLKGGTTGQILAKNTNTDMDFVWITNDVGDITAVTAGTGISGGGTSGAVTITNSMATEITAKADLIVGTGNATFDNLPVGANGTVLTADSTVSPTGLKWAAVTSGMTLLKKASFSNVADTGTTFDSLFTSAYDNYVIVINNLYGANSADDPQIQFRYAGPTTQASTYNWRYAQTEGTAWTSFGGASGSNFLTLAERIGGTNGYGSSFTVNAMNILSAGSRPYVTWSGFIEDEKFVVGGGYQYTSRTYTGFLIKSSAGNVSGTALVYGLANA